MKTEKNMKKMGQNTAEYMLLLLLIGGGSVVAFKMFGSGIINRFASVTSIITGKGQVAVPTDLTADKDKKVDFGTFDSQENKSSGAPTP